MQLNTLKPKHEHKNKRPRVGRGGKRGTSSGKGTKGQKSRSGRRIRPAIRDLIQRLPKLRGYANKPLLDSMAAVNVGQLAKLTAPVVTLASLKEAGLIRAAVTRVKILGTGELTKALKVEGLPVSAGAKMKIEKAGGQVVA